MLVWKSSVISLTSYFQDTFQTAKPIPDYLQTFQTLPNLTLIPDISGRYGNSVIKTSKKPGFSWVCWVHCQGNKTL